MLSWQNSLLESIDRALLVLLGIAFLLSGCAGVFSIAPKSTQLETTHYAETESALHSPSPSDPKSSRIDWGPFSDLSRLELAFQGVTPDDVVYVNGPYELVYWDEMRVELVGEAFPDLEPAHLTLLQRGPQLWAHLRVLDAEYLTRVE